MIEFELADPTNESRKKYYPLKNNFLKMAATQAIQASWRYATRQQAIYNAYPSNLLKLTRQKSNEFLSHANL